MTGIVRLYSQTRKGPRIDQEYAAEFSSLQEVAFCENQMNIGLDRSEHILIEAPVGPEVVEEIETERRSGYYFVPSLFGDEL
jgi:hypothetical protein